MESNIRMNENIWRMNMNSISITPEFLYYPRIFLLPPFWSYCVRRSHVSLIWFPGYGWYEKLHSKITEYSISIQPHPLSFNRTCNFILSAILFIKSIPTTHPARLPTTQATKYYTILNITHQIIIYDYDLWLMITYKTNYFLSTLYIANIIKC